MYNMDITANMTGSEPSREVMHITDGKSLSTYFFHFVQYYHITGLLKFHFLDSVGTEAGVP